MRIRPRRMVMLLSPSDIGRACRRYNSYEADSDTGFELRERLLDQPVEGGGHRAVGSGMVAEEEEIGRPLLDAVGELDAAVLDEALQGDEVVAVAVAHEHR